MLATAGVDVDSVLERLRREYAGQGGPFVAIAEAADPLPAAERARTLEVVEDLERANLLKVAAQRMPFGRPLGAARLTSGFGGRRDPINGRRGFHEGVDFAGPHGSAILTPADGVVTFSGRMRGYGRVVKIRHDFGFETVYAHLSRARVARGQSVSRGDRIGDMGNTGRSTGTHLHYEIRIDGEPVNPMNFIEAARNVH
jgi:murein DD-endopeptidase MepM/ murein hydrolase activator NlpD